MKAAVNGQDLAGDVGGGVGEQEGDRPRDVVGLPQAPEGDAAGDRRARLRRHRGGHVGLDEAGGHRVHGDGPRGHLPGDRLGEADEPGLARGVVGLSRVAGQPDDRRDVDDAAVALLQHGPQRRPRAVEGAAEVRVEDLVPLLRLHAQEQVVPGHAGVVDQVVEPALGGHDRLDGRGRGGPVAHVERESRSLPPRLRDLLHGLGQPGPVPRAEVDVRALAGQRPGDGPPDAAGSARDERDAAGEGSRRHAVLAAGDSADSVFSSEAGSSTFRTFVPLTMRLTRPESTVPAPTSTKVVAPCRASSCTPSCQRTGAETWRTSASRHSSPVRTSRASTLFTMGTTASRNGTRARSAASRDCAGAMSAQWKGAETARRTAFRAPAALQASTARSTAVAWPAIATCPGAFMLAGLTTCPCAASRQACFTAGRSSPMMAAIAPSPAGTASCMYSPRRRTATTASFSSRARTATRAEYSPRLCPATQPGRAP